MTSHYQSFYFSWSGTKKWPTSSRCFYSNKLAMVTSGFSNVKCFNDQFVLVFSIRIRSIHSSWKLPQGRALIQCWQLQSVQNNENLQYSAVPFLLITDTRLSREIVGSESEVWWKRIGVSMSMIYIFILQFYDTNNEWMNNKYIHRAEQGSHSYIAHKIVHGLNQNFPVKVESDLIFDRLATCSSFKGQITIYLIRILPCNLFLFMIIQKSIWKLRFFIRSGSSAMR